MLVVMTFNAYFYIAAAIGAGIGYLLFGAVNIMLMTKVSSYLDEESMGGMKNNLKNQQCPGQSSIASHSVNAQVFDTNDVGMTDIAGPSNSYITQLIEGSEDNIGCTPERERQLLMVTKELDEPVQEEHRTSDIAGLLSEEITVDIHI